MDSILVSRLVQVCLVIPLRSSHFDPSIWSAGVCWGSVSAERGVFRPFEETVNGRKDFDRCHHSLALPPSSACTVDTSEVRRNADGRCTTGGTLNSLLSQFVKMPVPHVSPRSGCRFKVLGLCCDLPLASVDLHDSAVLFLGCDLCLPERLGMTEMARPLLRCTGIAAECDGTAPIKNPRILQKQASSTD